MAKRQKLTDALGRVTGERTRRGLEAQIGQIDKELAVFGDSVRTLTPEEVAELGLPQGTIVQQDAAGNFKFPGKSGVTVNTGDTTDKFYETLDAANAKVFSTLDQAGINARRNMGRIDRLEQLLQTAPQGFVGSAMQIAGNFGLDTEGLSEIQAAQAVISSLVPEQRPPGSGPMSDADLIEFKASLPRIINQPGGNELILNTLRGIARYDIEAGEIAAAVASREITQAEARKRLSELENPLSFLNDVKERESGENFSDEEIEAEIQRRARGRT